MYRISHDVFCWKTLAVDGKWVLVGGATCKHLAGPDPCAYTSPPKQPKQTSCLVASTDTAPTCDHILCAHCELLISLRSAGVGTLTT